MIEAVLWFLLISVIKRNKMKKSILLIFILLFDVGCTTPYQSNNIYTIPSIEKRTLDDTSCLYKHEPWAKNKKRPTLGIALSGGGSKAAPFAMGVLKRFVDEGWIDDVDIISSVSGGGYSAYYFYSKLMWNHEYDEVQLDYRNFFKSCWIDTCEEVSEEYYQHHVKSYQDIFLKSKSEELWSDSHKDELASASTVLGGLFRSLLITPLHHTANTLFDWKVELSPTQYQYKEGIIRTYGIMPSKFHEDAKLGEYEKSQYQLKFSDLKLLIEQKNIPLWIINSANFERKWYSTLEGYSNLDNSIFEITPYGFGSGRQDYSTDSPDTLGLDIPRAVLSSAAFLDATGEKSGQELLFAGLHFLNFRWGVKIPKYTASIERQSLHNLLPFPLYYFDMNSSKITLADGGQSGDNLGVYSLIKRGTKNIVIVSGGYDLDLGSKNLKLKNICAVSNFLSAKGFSIKFEGTPNSKVNEWIEFNKNFCQKDGIFYKKIAFDNWKKPIYKGVVLDAQGEEVSKLFFIKAAIDRETLYPSFLERFLRDEKYAHESQYFPQTTTVVTTLNSSQSLYQAYMALGFYLSGELREEFNKKK
jgi:hypothetical protein